MDVDTPPVGAIVSSMTAQDILNQLRNKVEADYKRGLELVKFMEETMPDMERDLSSVAAGMKDSPLPTPAPQSDSPQLERGVKPRSQQAIDCGKTLPTPFSQACVLKILQERSVPQATKFVRVWNQLGWIQRVSHGWYQRTEIFGHHNSSAVAPAPVDVEKINNPVVTLKEPVVAIQPGKENLPTWTCQKCQQVNSGWSANCGRCETLKNAPVRNPQVDAINGIPEMREVSKLVEKNNGHPWITSSVAFLALPMTDKIRKIIMGLGPNAELRRHDLIQALKANVTPWTTKLDGEVTTSLTWLLVQGELKKIGRGVMSVYRISDMKPVASTGELVGKISTKEEEWKKLRETITVPRDILEDIGVDK